MDITVEEWHSDHARWSELLALVTELNQVDWLNFTVKWHHSSHVLVAQRGSGILGFLRFVIQDIGPDVDCPPLQWKGENLREAKVIAFGVPPAQRRQLDLFRSDFVGMAVEEFILDAPMTMQVNQTPKPINQGDIYWVPVEETEYTHPHVVIQENVINYSRVNTVVVCALSTNRKQANAPGNVLLDAGEANLPKQSVVVVSQVSSVDKRQLGAYIGSLSQQRLKQVLSGMQFLQSITGSG
jgi:mRNA interferase MazF